jgi:3-phosphoshikimate 1-carboxyvinyltransferase
MIEIKQYPIKNHSVTVPGSKSCTHRIMIASALSDGLCVLTNCLKSEDTLLTLDALKHMGIGIHEFNDCIEINGTSGRFKTPDEPIFLGNSGTSMRLLCALSALARGTTVLTGTERMCQRPIQDLLDGLHRIGVEARSVNGNGCPPVTITGGEIEGGCLSLKCHISSQFLSALLLIGPCTQKGLEIIVTEGPVSKPYIDLTIDIMKRFGITVYRKDDTFFKVPGRQTYRSGNHEVEPDCSQASYFWAAAAVTGARIKVLGISNQTRQGDVQFAEVLKQMGCDVTYEADGIAVSGGKLNGIEVDMSHMPDVVPTLAVVAAFSRGTTIIKNVPHLKAKESDRINAVATELKKLGVAVQPTNDGMIIEGTPALKRTSPSTENITIETYNDHRIAMSFAVAGLRVPGILIKNERCVDKSFPNFWETFEELYA